MISIAPEIIKEFTPPLSHRNTCNYLRESKCLSNAREIHRDCKATRAFLVIIVACIQSKNTASGCLKNVNSFSSFAVNALI